jgi:hypothetical protein
MVLQDPERLQGQSTNFIVRADPLASRIGASMLDQLEAIIQLLRQTLRVIEAIGGVALGAVEADNTADTTHDGKQLSGTDGNPAGTASWSPAA